MLTIREVIERFERFSNCAIFSYFICNQFTVDKLLFKEIARIFEDNSAKVKNEVAIRP